MISGWAIGVLAGCTIAAVFWVAHKLWQIDEHMLPGWPETTYFVPAGYPIGLLSDAIEAALAAILSNTTFSYPQVRSAMRNLDIFVSAPTFGALPPSVAGAIFVTPSLDTLCRELLIRCAKLTNNQDPPWELPSISRALKDYESSLAAVASRYER